MMTAELPPIPIPPRMLELLKDYPELIQEIRDMLNSHLKRPSYSQPLDQALWALQDKLEALFFTAHQEVKLSENSGDAEAIARAKAKVSLVSKAYSKNGGLKDINNICDYFEEHEDAFS